jgi:hypothetical protein
MSQRNLHKLTFHNFKIWYKWGTSLLKLLINLFIYEMISLQNNIQSN